VGLGQAVVHHHPVLQEKARDFRVEIKGHRQKPGLVLVEFLVQAEAASATEVNQRMDEAQTRAILNRVRDMLPMCRAQRSLLMRVGRAWWFGVAVVLCGGLTLGCTAAGKPLVGTSMPGVKRDDKSLRAAVEKDPFPRAQGMTAAGKS
jgi:hypothetical protein